MNERGVRFFWFARPISRLVRAPARALGAVMRAAVVITQAPLRIKAYPDSATPTAPTTPRGWSAHPPPPLLLPLPTPGLTPPPLGLHPRDHGGAIDRVRGEVHLHSQRVEARAE